MKKVMIYAYTHFNLGDDLFIKILCERYPNTMFLLYAPRQYKHIFKGFRNIRFYPSDALLIRGLNYLFRFRQLLAKKSDAGVHIGGSLFIQQENWKKEFKKTRHMQIKGRPLFLLGANFGPFTDEGFYFAHKELFKTYTDICFREEHSYQLFAELPQVRLADDIVFQLKKKDRKPQINTIVLSVIKPSIRKHLTHDDALYYRKMRDIAVLFMDKGYHVTLMSFCGLEGDEEAVESIRKLIPESSGENLTTFFYRQDIEAALEQIASASFVVASRFHAMVLAWVYEKPVFPIVYSDKMIHVMEDVGFNGTYTDFSDLDTLQAEDVFISMTTNTLNISKQIENSKKQFERLDAYLKE